MARSVTVHERALTILRELQEAQAELFGKGVVLANGRAGTVDGVLLDDLHGLRITVQGYEGDWPVSTIKFAEEQ